MPSFCIKCGAKLPKNDAKFCKFCGAATARKGAEKSKKKSSQTKVNMSKYPSLWRRYFAYLIDTMTVFPIFFVVGILWVIVGLDASVFDTIPPFTDWLITGVVLALYLAFFESKWGSSIGKWFFNLKVATESNERITFKTGFIRNIVKPIPYFPILEWFVAVKDVRKQSLHDRWAKTLVVNISELYKGEKKHHQPQTWQKVLAVIVVLIGFAYYTSISIEEGGADTFIREGVRNIQTKVLLNTDLFSALEDRKPQGTTKFVTTDFDFSNQMAAVVSLVCEEDGGDFVGGSAVVVSSNGLLLTNKHVVENVTENYCIVGFTKDPALDPEYAFYADTEFYNEDESFTVDNEEIDTAILQIVSATEGYSMPESFPTIGMIGSSDSLVFNDEIYVIGYPSFGGNTLTLTKGVMSGRVGDDFIKTSAKIDSGNSGGAALNEDGELIGMPTFIIGGTTEGLGYIVGIDSILDWMEPLLNN